MFASDESCSRMYDLEEKVGSGAFGEVRLAVHRAHGRTVALKAIKLHKASMGNNQRLPKAIFREVEAVHQLKHPNIVECYDLFPSEASVTLVLEYCPTDLAAYISECQTHLSIRQVKAYARMIISAINHCHKNNVIHRDIKPSSKPLLSLLKG